MRSGGDGWLQARIYREEGLPLCKRRRKHGGQAPGVTRWRSRRAEAREIIEEWRQDYNTQRPGVDPEVRRFPSLRQGG